MNIVIFLLCLFFWGCNPPPKEAPQGELAKIWVYTDFGCNPAGPPVSDFQTADELTAQVWRSSHGSIGQVDLNDGAVPLSPADAAAALAATFPYRGESHPSHIDQIVVHVIDPGVGNGETDGEHANPRSAILRKDGTLFIGPDNGTLSLACPPGSIARGWRLSLAAAQERSGNDFSAGGTFHGRDLFIEVAAGIAAGIYSLDEVGFPYSTPELAVRIAVAESSAARPIEFASLSTDKHWFRGGVQQESSEEFEAAFLLGIVQSPLRAREGVWSLYCSLEEPEIAVINRSTGNLYLGPNNGLATPFASGFKAEDLHIVVLTDELRRWINEGPSNQQLVGRLLEEPPAQDSLLFLSGLTATSQGQEVVARIWVDAYGNLKTTLESRQLNELLAREPDLIEVELNGVTRTLRVASTFSEVPEGELFLYTGSSGVIGLNWDRSNRYVEVSANGVYGTFGCDFFTTEERRPQNGDFIHFRFKNRPTLEAQP